MSNPTDVITPDGVLVSVLRDELVQALEIVLSVQPEDALRVLTERIPAVDPERHALRCALHEAVDTALADLGIDPEPAR